MLLATCVSCLSVAACAATAVAAPEAAALPQRIVCEGTFPYHLQGVATDGKSIYWSYTTVLAKTDLTGHLLASNVLDRGHMGDLCCHGGKVYVGYRGREDGVLEYDAATLKPLRTIPTPQTVFFNNGLEWYDGAFYVIGAAPDHSRYNVVCVYDSAWNYRGCRFIDSGWTFWGVQTVAKIGSNLVFGYYGNGRDKTMPHPGGAFFVDGKELATSGRRTRYSEVVSSLGRKVGNFGEGIVELGGHAWVAGSSGKPASAGSPTKMIYTGDMVRAPQLEEAP